jgi:hypothetical protein
MILLAAGRPRAVAIADDGTAVVASGDAGSVSSPGSAPARTAAPSPSEAAACAPRFEAGLVVALPSALPASISTGIGGGVTQRFGAWLEWGARAGFVSASESTEVWTVTQSEVRVRALAGVRHVSGRGTLALRLGLGPTLVHETRVRNQGMRAGLSGSALETTAWAALPAADLELAVALRLKGPWSLILGGGPALDVVDGRLRGGWSAGLGAGWQP